MVEPRKEKTLYVCTACGACCTWPGYVRMTEKEIDRMATFLDLPVATFIDTYTTLTDDRRGLTLIEKPNNHCIFFERPAECKVYPVRPKQCRDFPNKWAFSGFRTRCRSVGIRYWKTAPDTTECEAAYFPEKNIANAP